MLRRHWVLFAASSLSLSSGCFMAGAYRSAKPLEKGVGEMGLSVSMTRYPTSTNTDPTSDGFESVPIPNLIPEITYHLGVGDNAEVGGRIAVGSLGAEGDVKYRFLHSGKLHLAIIPALSYQTAVLFEAARVNLPLVGTLELSDMVDVTATGFVTQTRFGSPSNDFKMFDGNLTSSGLSLGIGVHGDTFSMRAGLEFTQYLANLRSSDDFESFNTANFMVHLGWKLGREKQQLNRMERKLDNLQPPPYPPQAYPPQAYPPPAQPYPPQAYPPPAQPYPPQAPAQPYPPQAYPPSAPPVYQPAPSEPPPPAAPSGWTRPVVEGAPAPTAPPEGSSGGWTRPVVQ